VVTSDLVIHHQSDEPGVMIDFTLDRQRYIVVSNTPACPEFGDIRTLDEYRRYHRFLSGRHRWNEREEPA
jgi:hypothetical protein